MYCHIYKITILKGLMDMLMFHPTCRVLGRLTELLATNTGTTHYNLQFAGAIYVYTPALCTAFVLHRK
jgi:hypothetical protein